MERTDSKIDTPLAREDSRPVHAPKGPHVYFIRADNAVKIGFSEIVGRRFAGLQSGHAVDLELLGTVPASGGTERAYHERFAHLHIRGEWFRAEPELLDAIAADCSGLVEPDGEADYAEQYKAFRAATKHLVGSRLIFWRTQVLCGLGQLAQNKNVPPDIRDWHRGIHLEGLKEARTVFDQMVATA